MRHAPQAPLLSAVLLVALTILGTRQILAANAPASVATVPVVAHELHDHLASAVVASAACTPRPRIVVSTRVEAGRLRVQVGATTSSTVPTNGVHALRFGRPTNAQVRLGDQTTFTTNRDLSLPSPSSTYVFYVERTGGGDATVPFTVVDACGEWSTFVGGGSSTLPLAPTPTSVPTQSPTPTSVPTQSPTPTSSPTQTPTPATQTPAPTTQPTQSPVPTQTPTTGHDSRFWHPPTDHEHGDAPPQWIMDAGYTAAFDHHGGFHGNTSPAENTAKHAAMKGFLAEFTDYAGGTQQVYFRVHIASNVLDRMARYHSYEVFMRDATGAVSHWQGWFNSGDPASDRVVYNAVNDPGRRPIVLVQDETTFPTVKNEHWYMRSTAPWNWDFAWTVDATTYWFPNEVENTDMSTWRPTGRLGTVRRFEPAWYGPDSKVAASRTWGVPRGSTFYATQFGEIVSGPSSARCSGTTTLHGVTYQNLCLPQYIATTARAVEHLIPGGNPRERIFPGIGLGVRLPN